MSYYKKKVWESQDPDEVIAYSWDWSQVLGADTISTSTWALSADNADALLTISGDAKTTQGVTWKLSGGTDKVAYEFVNRIVTVGGQTFEQGHRITIRAK